VLDSVVVESGDEHELVVTDVRVQSWVEVYFLLAWSEVDVRRSDVVSVDNFEDLVALRAAQVTA
jgi:hypothetical protein